jgi:TM2 domain-containing membrane protein YozV
MTDNETFGDVEQAAQSTGEETSGAEMPQVGGQEPLPQIGQPARALITTGPPVLAQGPTPAMVQDQRINNAFILELVGGVLGFLGLGYMYVGRTSDGVIRLVVWWLVIGAMWTTITLLSAVLVGLCLVPLGIAVQLGGPIYSALQLKKLLLAEAGLPQA